MVKTVSGYSLAAVLATLLMFSTYAEIIGSGFRDINCTGEFAFNLFVDHNGDGVKSKNEEGIADAELRLSLSNYPALGVEKFVTNADGMVYIGALCKGIFSIEIEPSTLPLGLVFDGVYEAGVLLIDSRLDDGIDVALDGGVESNAPGMRYLDIAFTSDIRGLR